MLFLFFFVLFSVFLSFVGAKVHIFLRSTKFLVHYWFINGFSPISLYYLNFFSPLIASSYIPIANRLGSSNLSYIAFTSELSFI